VADVSTSEAGRLWDAKELGIERIEGPVAVSESGDSMRFLLRFIGERIARDSPDSERRKVEELLALGLAVKDGESLPEWEEDAGVDPNDGG
jgi:hypothetical protein